MNIRQVPIKCVKESVVLEIDNSEVLVLHYNTLILKLVKGNQLGQYTIATIYRASVTSSKMINRVLDYYGVDR
jgi:hypothetical protein